MSNSFDFKAYQIHELTMLYLKNQDLSNLSETEIYDEYIKRYKSISEYAQKNGKQTVSY